MTLTSQELVAKAKTTKLDATKENFLIIYFNYDNQLLLPYKDGIAVLAALAKAERHVDEYNSRRIEPLNKESMRSFIVSGKEYEAVKMAQLLGVTYSEFQNALEVSTQSK